MRPVSRTAAVIGAALAAAAAIALSATACSAGGPAEPASITRALDQRARTASTARAATLPRLDHVVVVIEENHSYGDVLGSPSAPYLNQLAAQGAWFTSSYAVAHPSEPNYLALFSGSTQQLTDDSCPHTLPGPTLGSELQAAGLSFTGYSESLPSVAYTGCTAGDYARKHNPWADFPATASSANRPFAQFPHDYAALPTVSFVIPNLQDDMHDGSVQRADAWLRQNLSGYVAWARTHNSELVVTWDEDDGSATNRIPSLIVGAKVRPGQYAEPVDHYRMLRTLEDLFALPAAGRSADRAPISDIWQS